MRRGTPSRHWKDEPVAVELNDDATLSALSLSGLDIGPFASDVTEYTAQAEHDVAATTVHATASDSAASVVITDANGSTAGGARSVHLQEGANTVTVAVSAADGTTREDLHGHRSPPGARGAADGALLVGAGVARRHSHSRCASRSARRSASVGGHSRITWRWGTAPRRTRVGIDGRHDLWEIAVQPAADADVTLAVPPSAACGEPGAICDRATGTKPLSNRLEATVAGPSEAAEVSIAAGASPVTEGTGGGVRGEPDGGGGGGADDDGEREGDGGDAGAGTRLPRWRSGRVRAAPP